MTTQETTALAPRLEDQLAGMDFGEFTGEQKRIPFGYFGWMRGDKGGKRPGVFYARQTEFGVPPGLPWQEDDRFADSKDPELGYSAALLNLAFIGKREQWYVEQTNQQTGKKFKQWLPHYKPDLGAQKQAEFLCFVEGSDNPMILVGKKQSKTKPFNEIISTYRRGLLHQAMLRMRISLPDHSFWLPIQGEMKDGKPFYAEMKGRDGDASYVTNPVCVLPPNAIDTLFVGKERLQYGMELRRQYAWWFEEKRTDAVEAEYEIEEAEPLKQLLPGRNVPQPVDDGDTY